MDSDKRLNQLQQLLEQDASDPFLHYALAMEYLKREQPEAARQKFVYLTEHHPDYVGVYYHFGKLEESQDAPERALDWYEKGIAIAEKQQDAHAARELREALNLCKTLYDLDDDEWDD